MFEVGKDIHILLNVTRGMGYKSLAQAIIMYHGMILNESEKAIQIGKFNYKTEKWEDIIWLPKGVLKLQETGNYHISNRFVPSQYQAYIFSKCEPNIISA